MYHLTGVSLNKASVPRCLILGRTQNPSPHLDLHFRAGPIIGQANTMSKHTPCLWESSDPDSDLNSAGWTKPYGNYHLNTWLISYANLSGEEKKNLPNTAAWGAMQLKNKLLYFILMTELLGILVPMQSKTNVILGTSGIHKCSDKVSWLWTFWCCYVCFSTSENLLF